MIRANTGSDGRARTTLWARATREIHNIILYIRRRTGISKSTKSHLRFHGENREADTRKYAAGCVRLLCLHNNNMIMTTERKFNALHIRVYRYRCEMCQIFPLHPVHALASIHIILYKSIATTLLENDEACTMRMP